MKRDTKEEDACKLQVTRKKQRIPLGTKIVSVFFLCIGLFLISWGAFAELSGQGQNTRPVGAVYFFIIFPGAVFVIVAVLVFLDARFHALPTKSLEVGVNSKHG